MLGTRWELGEHNMKNKNLAPQPSQKEKNLARRASSLTFLVARIDFAYLCSLPFLA
jgi:hypothetical protein